MSDSNITASGEKNGTNVGTKKGLILGGAIGGAVLLIAVILCVVLGSPKRKIVNAVKHTMSLENLQEADPMTEVLGTKEMAQLMRNQGGELSLNLELVDFCGDASAGGLGISLDAAIDRQNKKALLDAKLTDASLDSGEAIDVRLLNDEEKTYLSVGDQLDSFLSISNKNVISGFNQSFLAGEDYSGPLDMADFDIDLYAMPSENNISKNAAGYEKFLEEVKTAVTNLYKKSGVKKAGSEVLSLDGRSVKTKKYVVTFKKEDLEETLSSICSSYAALVGTSDTEDAADAVSTVNTWKENILSMVTGDVPVEFNLKGNQVVEISAATADDQDGYVVEYAYILRFMGEQNPLTNIELDYTAAAGAESEQITLSIDSSSYEEGVSRTFNLVLQQNDMYVGQLMGTWSYYTADQTVGIDLLGSLDADTISVNASGAFTEITPGVSYTCDLDSISVNMNGVDLLTAVGSMKQGACTADFSMPTGNEKDLFAISEDEFMGIIDNNTDAISDISTNVIMYVYKIQGMLEALNDENLGSGYDDSGDGDYEDLGDGDIIDLGGGSSSADYTDFLYTFANGQALTVKKLPEDFICNYVDANFVSFNNSDYSQALEYDAAEGEYMTELGDVAEYFKTYEDAIYVSEQVEAKMIGDLAVYFVKVTETSDGITNHYFIARPVADGEFIMMLVSARTENSTLTEDEIMSWITDEYISLQ